VASKGLTPSKKEWPKEEKELTALMDNIYATIILLEAKP